MFGRFILLLSLKRLISGKYFTEKGIIETMKKWLMLLLISFVIFLPACEGRDNDIRTEENDGKNAEKTVEEKNQNKKNLDTINAIPERDRYMFTCGTCEGELPAKENITKIAISKIAKPDSQAPYIEVYGVIDFMEKTIEYSYLEGSRRPVEPEVVQNIELTDEDINSFLDTFDGSFLKDEIEFDDDWDKLAVEYSDGTCYAYEIREGRYTYGSPENNMMCDFFDKMELSDSDRMFLFLGLSNPSE